MADSEAAVCCGCGTTATASTTLTTARKDARDVATTVPLLATIAEGGHRIRIVYHSTPVLVIEAVADHQPGELRIVGRMALGA